MGISMDDTKHVTCDWCSKKVRVTIDKWTTALIHSRNKQKWYCSPKCEHEVKQANK